MLSWLLASFLPTFAAALPRGLFGGIKIGIRLWHFGSDISQVVHELLGER
jgi:hypothetical protein